MPNMMQQQQPMPNNQEAPKTDSAPAFAQKGTPPASSMVGLD